MLLLLLQLLLLLLLARRGHLLLQAPPRCFAAAPQLQPRHASRPRAVGAAYAAAGYETFVGNKFMLFLLVISFVFYLSTPRCTLTRCQLCRSSHQTRRRSGHSVCGWPYFFNFSSMCFSSAATTVEFFAASTCLRATAQQRRRGEVGRSERCLLRCLSAAFPPLGVGACRQHRRQLRETGSRRQLTRQHMGRGRTD